MGLMRYGCLPTARMQMFYLTSGYRDLAILDFSTQGHALFNFGHPAWASSSPPAEGLFSAQLQETDIVTGSGKKLFAAVDEILEKGYRHIFLMPSSLAEVMGLDLEGFAAEIREKTGAHVFTVKAKLNADYYAGAEAFYTALAQKLARPSDPQPLTYNILGGCTFADRIDRQYLTSLLDGLSLKCNVDMLTSTSFQDLQQLPRAAVNIVTSRFALKAAEVLKKANGTPYVCFNTLSPSEEHDFLSSAAELTGRAAPAFCQDEVFSGMLMQVKNILEMTRPDILCYGDTDKLRALESFFTQVGYEAIYLCSHKKGQYPYADPDEIVSRYGDKTVLTYDHLCRHIPRSIPIQESGLLYTLHPPLKDFTIGKDGAYRICKALTDLLLHGS